MQPKDFTAGFLSATFSTPSPDAQRLLGRPYVKVKIRALQSPSGERYLVEKFTKTQAFHEHLDFDGVRAFIEAHAGKTFRNCVVRTADEEISIRAGKNGETLRTSRPAAARKEAEGNDRGKNHLLREGEAVPFLVKLGVMTGEGKVVSSKRGKFRQINRFLEFVDDIADSLLKGVPKSRPLRVVDFGCGKSYLTFALFHYFSIVKKIDCEIKGVDVKADLVDGCEKLARSLGFGALSFAARGILGFDADGFDLMISLHACDTATDDAIAQAVKGGCRAMLCVPCCQMELRRALDSRAADPCSPFAPLLRHGISRERFASMATDALRAEYLERAGYDASLVEFAGDEDTAKNILIRALKRERRSAAREERAAREAAALEGALGAELSLKKSLGFQ